MKDEDGLSVIYQEIQELLKYDPCNYKAQF